MSDQVHSAAVAEQLSVSDAAREQLRQLTAEEGSFLRIWVEQGGCSGMSYKAVIDTVPGPLDVELFNDGGLRVVTDRGSRQHVEGIRVDYSSDLVKAGFRFMNPRASGSCGCGQSFRP